MSYEKGVCSARLRFPEKSRRCRRAPPPSRQSCGGSALGLDGAVAPSDLIVMAWIGYGMQGGSDMRNLPGIEGVQWVAVCDLDDHHLSKAAEIVSRKYGNRDYARYKDFRKHYAAALRAGPDVYGEKPLTYSPCEGRALSPVGTAMQGGDVPRR